jgi:hypothetical protein
MMAFSAKKTDPTICIVNLEHPTLNVPGKKQAAQPIVKELKAHGEMAWARYQAINEVSWIPIIYLKPLCPLDALQRPI